MAEDPAGVDYMADDVDLPLKNVCCEEREIKFRQKRSMFEG